MPLLTILIEDTSPILRFSTNGWFAGVSSDASADQYTQSTFTISNTQGTTMTLVFNGTEVELFGALRSDHGSYSVNVDGMDSPTLSGFSNNSIFNQSLYSSDKLEQKMHTAVLTNQGGTFIDIDYVTIQTQIGNDTEDLIINTFQDMHPAIKYTPPESWHTPDTVSSFSGATGHATQDPSASMSMSFNGKSRPCLINKKTADKIVAGDGIAVYGPVGPNQTNSYSVQIDNGPLLPAFAAYYQFYRPQQILYLATNLGGGNHTITLKTTGSPGSELAIDYVNVYTAASLGGSFSSVPTSSQLQGMTVTRIPNNIYAVLALTSTCTLAGLLYFGYRFWLKFRQNKLTPSGTVMVPIQGPQTADPFVAVPNDGYGSIPARQANLKQGTYTAVDHTPSNLTTTSSGTRLLVADTHHHSLNPPAYMSTVE